MDKKITIKDIAKQAGVSVATVSYVINNRTDQRISEETRKKILHIVNLLDYKPNSSAKSLATSKTFNIALYVMPEVSLIKRSEQLLVIEVLAEVLKKQGYHLVFQSSKDIVNLNNVDAILCYDATFDFFHSIGDKNFIPLIAIDTLIDIPLFFQICTDYKAMKEKADEHFGKDNYTYVCLTPNNSLLKTHITESFANTTFIQDFHELSDSFMQNIIYSQESLQPLLAGRKSAYYIPCDHYKKMKKVFDCIELAISRVPDTEHQHFV